jgi:integrase
MAETQSPAASKRTKPKGIAPWEEVTSDDKPQTIGSLVETFLANQKQAAEVGEISAARYDKLRVNMKKFLDCIDSDLPASKLDNAMLNHWRGIVSKQVADGIIAPVTGRDCLAITKRFVNFAYNRGYLEVIPRCLTARGQDSFTIAVKRKEIVTAELGDVHRLLAVASSKAKLVIFLGLNCGYGPRDISGIFKREIDFKRGTLTRSRTKTSKRDKPTIVTFKLWPETLSAIKANLSDHPTLAFTTDNGNPLVNETIGSDGIVKRHDAVHSIWFRLSKHAKVDTKLRQLRKLGATILKRKFPHFVDHYLSHAAGRVSDQHYAATHQEGFDDALAWLRSEILPQEN